MQSCVVSDDFAGQFRVDDKQDGGGQYKKELVEALTSMWNGVASGASDVPVYNKKLHVKHVVDVTAIQEKGGDNTTIGGSNNAPSVSSASNAMSADKMSREQLAEENSSLKRKYDELVAFSVNLTAERDILNNTLEQTRRDLNREVASRQALEKQGVKAARGGGQEKSKGNGGMSMNTLILVGVLGFFMAVRATNTGAVGFLQSVPVLGGLLGFHAGAAPRGGDSGPKDEL